MAPTKMMEVSKTALLQGMCEILVSFDLFTEAGGVRFTRTHVKVNAMFYEIIQPRYARKLGRTWWEELTEYWQEALQVDEDAIFWHSCWIEIVLDFQLLLVTERGIVFVS